MMSIYQLVDSSGAVVNTIEWDGTTPYTPPSGLTARIYTPPAPTPPTLAQQAQTALAAPVDITSTSTPSLNGAYAITDIDQAHITAVVTNILLTGSFPGGASTYDWPDASGALHTFPSVAEFKSFATALSAYVAALIGCTTGAVSALPNSSITIS
jgi:hypothetical protein